MKRGKLIIGMISSITVLAGLLTVARASTAQQAPSATFKSGVDLVRVSAVVRDRKGRFVGDLSARDFTVLDGGETRPIAEFRHELTGVSVALLFDVSGSMQGRLTVAREAGTHVLSWLEPRDEASVFTFDTRLDEVEPFTEGLHVLPDRLSSLKPFGATSLHDAIAATARRTAEREGRHRAVVVLTDGNDNWSQLKPTDVSAIASAIDVPVYIVGLVPAIDNPSTNVATVTPERSALAGPLTDLAVWTGGHAFLVSTPAERSVAARQIVDELRQQYLIAFEASGVPGWHSVAVHARDKNLVVRARSGYFAGQSRPTSQ